MLTSMGTLLLDDSQQNYDNCENNQLLACFLPKKISE